MAGNTAEPANWSPDRACPVPGGPPTMKTSRGAVAAALVAGSLVATYAATNAAGSTSGPKGSVGTPVVGDRFHPGYEPDIAVDKAGKYRGSTFASVPNGFSTTMSYIWRSDDNRRS